MCQIWANDSDGNILTVFWYENTTGDWVLRQTNSSVSANSTVSWIFTQASNYSITYWWKVAVNDGSDNVSEWYSFSTRAINTSVNNVVPYVVTSSSFDISASGDSDLNNVTLYYRYSVDNLSWVSSYQVTFSAAGAGAAGTSSSITPGYPNGLQVNDLMILHVMVLGTSEAPSTPIGWTLKYGPHTTGGNDGRVWVFYKFSTGSETGTLTLNGMGTTAGKFARIYSFKYVDLSQPFSSSGDWQTSTGNTISDVGVTNTIPKEYTVNLVSVGEDIGNTYSSFTGESGGDWTELVAEYSNGAGADGTLQIQGAVMASAGTINGGSYNMGFFSWDPAGVIGFSLKPITWMVWNNISNPDTGSPWNWSFGFPNGTGYYEFYSIGKKSGSIDETPPISADAICVYNRPPTITNEVPGNGSTNIQIIPQMNISINDIDGNGMNITWYSNSSGSWQVFGVNNSVLNGTYYQINSNFSSPGITYWWYVSVYDGVNTNNSGIFHFTTSYQAVISNPSPSNGSVAQYTVLVCNVTVSDADGGTVTIRFYENITGGWVLQQTNSSVDVTNPANVIWNNFSNATGDYTIYWWLVNVSDGKGCFVEEIYHFTTANTSIDITPDRWDQGVLQIGGSNETSGFYFNLTNNGDTNLYIQIKASNATNITTGVKWILNVSSGFDNFTLQYNKSSGGVWTTINLTYDLFISSLGAGTWQTFDLRLIMANWSSIVDPLSMDLTFRSVKV